MDKDYLGRWQQWWRNQWSSGILSEQAGLEYHDGLRLFLSQNCCLSILTGCQSFSNNVDWNGAYSLVPYSSFFFLFPIIIYCCKKDYLGRSCLVLLATKVVERSQTEAGLVLHIVNKLKSLDFKL